MQHDTPTHLPFVKMHGIGNDFVVLDTAVAGMAHDWPALARAVCDRHVGIGADGLLLVAPGDGADFHMRVFNPDGSEAEMCGNGIRCFARYVYDQGMVTRSDMTISTGAGVQRVRIVTGDAGAPAVEVDMGRPEFEAARVPVIAATADVVDRPLAVGGVDLLISCVSMGNPHAVAFVDAIDAFPLDHVGPLVEQHPWFPRRTNFEVCRVLDRGHIEMRVWERGAGITLACGTGACGTMAVAFRHGLVDSHVDVRLPGGHLQLAWDGVGSVRMTGPAAYVFAGGWPLS